MGEGDGRDGNAAEEAVTASMIPATAEQVFRPQWPEGLNTEPHRVLCDDKGYAGLTWFSVFVANDGDAHLMAHEEMEGNVPGDLAGMDPFPSIRVRNHAGGGRNRRTHQALLWLALAIKLDNEENHR